jgi:colicin import membrane protein
MKIGAITRWARWGLWALMCVTVVRAQETVPAIAEPATAAITMNSSEAERAAHSQQLIARRQRLEAEYSEAMTLCYQKFDVTSCRLDARERRLQAHAALRKDEIAFNAVERRIKADEAERRLAETNALARERAQTQQSDAAQNAKALADRAAQKQADHDAQGQQRDAYERKQREAAQRRADLEKKQRERDKSPAAPLPARGASQ